MVQQIKLHKEFQEHNQLLKVLTFLKELPLLKEHNQLLKGMLLLNLIKVLQLKVLTLLKDLPHLKGMLVLKELKVHKLKVDKKGKGRRNNKCLQHNLKVQRQRKKNLLLELTVLFQPSSSNFCNDYCYVM